MLTQVQHVTVGSTVRVKGVDYKVAGNRINNLVLNKAFVPGIYDKSEVHLRDLLPNISYGSLVEVLDKYTNPVKPVAEYTAPIPAVSPFNEAPAWTSRPANPLTEQLRKEKAKQDLTESLRQQVRGKGSWTNAFAEQEDDEYEEEDWDEDDEDWEEEECDCEDCRPSSYEEEAVAASYEYVPFIDTELEEVKESALRASLRSQAAEQQANQARLDNKIAVSQLGKRLDEHERAHNALANEFERFEFDVAVDRESYLETYQELEERVEAIEERQRQEAAKVDLQNQLTAKLKQQKLKAELEAQLNNQTTTKTTGGNGTMKNLFGAFKNQFGKVEGQFAFSMVTGGLALRKGFSNDFVAYNKETKELTDVSGLTFDMNLPAFKLPVREDAIAVGDLIIHNGEYVYVTGKADGYLETINPGKAVRGSVIPTKNAMFGAAFYTVVKTVEMAGQGGFNPMLLMAMSKGNKEEILPLLLMSGGLGNTGNGGGAIDPTMLMLMGDKMDDLLPLILMQQGGVAGQMNPMMLMAMAGGEGGNMKDMLMMQALTGQNLFGGQAPAAPQAGTQSFGKGNK